MFCPKCGTQLPDNAQFCANCGSALGRQGSEGAAAPYQTPLATQAAPAAAAVAVDASGVAVARKGVTPKTIGLIAVAAAALLAVVLGLVMCSGGGLLGPSVEVKESLADYSWAELSKISDQIARAGNEEEAVKIAVNYNLAGKDGSLDGSQVKLVGISGKQVPVRIIGFAHDEKTGGGKAGITFQFGDCIDSRNMNPKSTDEADLNLYAKVYDSSLEDVVKYNENGVGTNAGGWEASEMREWLNADFYDKLPEDVASVIVAVDKHTNNTGYFDSSTEEPVTTTSDLVWLPSWKEVTGGASDSDIQKIEDSYAESMAEASSGMSSEESSSDSRTEEISKELDQALVWVNTYNAEGSEYKLFRDINVDQESDNSILVKYYDGAADSWWLRTPAANYPTDFLYVGSSGRPDGFNGAFYDNGVAPCFCI